LAHKYLIILPALFCLFHFTAEDTHAQTKSYEWIPAPDVWYNDVDGIRLGIRLKGQVPGTFEDGPHRLDAGFWLSTWFPKTLVSYYLSFTEPIQSWSDYGNEASIQLISSIRTGYHQHGIGFNKRWQQGFDERKFNEFSTFITFEKRFDREYTPFPALWSEDEKLLTNVLYELQNENSLGRYNLSYQGSLQYLNNFYGAMTTTGTQQIPFNEYWGLRLRGYFGLASADSAPEYLFSRSSSISVNWLNSGLTRAKGTIPQPWMESGNVQVSGGANLRGYTGRDISSFDGSSGNPFLFNSIVAFNSEFDYYNPVAMLFEKIPYLTEFLSFRSYLFFDAGTPTGITDDSTGSLFADAGAGFLLSLNVPDYLGRQRGFVLRYDIPFWLSEPGPEEAFKIRHLIGIGAVISF
jgi:hypothetical protein